MSTTTKRRRAVAMATRPRDKGVPAFRVNKNGWLRAHPDSSTGTDEVRARLKTRSNSSRASVSLPCTCSSHQQPKCPHWRMGKCENKAEPWKKGDD